MRMGELEFWGGVVGKQGSGFEEFGWRGDEVVELRLRGCVLEIVRI